MIEAMKRAYADRAVFMGDPDAIKMPVDGLTSKKYAASLRAQIGERTTPSPRFAPAGLRLTKGVTPHTSP